VARLNFDVIVAGGGMAGLAAGLALARAGLDTAVVDAAPAQAQHAPTFDGRASAIAYANYRMLAKLGLGPALEGHVQRIEHILVSDGRAPDRLRRGGPGPRLLHFDRRDLDPREEGEPPLAEPLGYMLENRRLRLALLEAAKSSSRLTLIAPVKVAGVRLDPDAARVSLADGLDHEANLLERD
jgi:2-octaprenyl-6-methoxyphenol hydroxylase